MKVGKHKIKFLEYSDLALGLGMLLGIVLFFFSIIMLLIQLIRGKGKRVAIKILLSSILLILLIFCGTFVSIFMEGGTSLTESEETVLSYAQTLKDSLADRNSFDLRSARYYEGVGMKIAVLEIGGKNSFGGMVIATYYFHDSSNLGLAIYESTDRLVVKLENLLQKYQSDVIEINCKRIMEYLE